MKSFLWPRFPSQPTAARGQTKLFSTSIIGTDCHAFTPMDDDDSLHHSALFFSKTNCSRTFRILRGKGEGQICPAHCYEISEFFPFFLLVHHPISTRHFDSCQLVPGDSNPPNPGKLCGVGGQNVGKIFVIYFRSRILKSNKVVLFITLCKQRLGCHDLLLFATIWRQSTSIWYTAWLKRGALK